MEVFMAIDTHVHIGTRTSKNVVNDVKKVNESKLLRRVINVGIDVNTSKESIAIAAENPKFYAAFGIHPLHLKGQHVEELCGLGSNEKVVAIGEIGLDSLNNNYDEQKNFLISQISIANELHLPVIIHANNASTEVIDIFRRYVRPQFGCVFHCFQPEIEILKYLVDNNYYVSFAGRITYPTARKSIEMVKLTPSNLLLVETDSPFIKTFPTISGINESANVKYVLGKLAEVRKITYDDAEALTEVNARRLFRKLK